MMMLLIAIFSSEVDCQMNAHHNGHSHNDYEQDRPLYDALEMDFISVEADVYPYKGTLRVSHRPFKLKQKKTIDELYLIPLDSIISANNGTVYPADSSVFTLMIDLKWKKKKSLDMLLEKLDDYRHLLSKKEDGEMIWGPIQIVLTGSLPLKELSKDFKDYVFFDARPCQKYPNNLKDMVVLLSCGYSSVEVQRNTESKIKGYVKSSKFSGIRVRFWGIPNDTLTWNKLDALGVELIHVDDIKKFAAFRKKRSIKEYIVSNELSAEE